MMNASSSGEAGDMAPPDPDLRSIDPLTLCQAALQALDTAAYPLEIGARLSEVVEMLERQA